MVGQAAVHEFRIIYNLLSTYFYKRLKRDMQHKCPLKGFLVLERSKPCRENGQGLWDEADGDCV